MDETTNDLQLSQVSYLAFVHIVDRVFKLIYHELATGQRSFNGGDMKGSALALISETRIKQQQKMRQRERCETKLFDGTNNGTIREHFRQFSK